MPSKAAKSVINAILNLIEISLAAVLADKRKKKCIKRNNYLTFATTLAPARFADCIIRNTSP